MSNDDGDAGLTWHKDYFQNIYQVILTPAGEGGYSNSAKLKNWPAKTMVQQTFVEVWLNQLLAERQLYTELNATQCLPKRR